MGEVITGDKEGIGKESDNEMQRKMPDKKEGKVIKEGYKKR